MHYQANVSLINLKINVCHKDQYSVKLLSHKNVKIYISIFNYYLLWRKKKSIKKVKKKNNNQKHALTCMYKFKFRARRYRLHDRYSVHVCL